LPPQQSVKYQVEIGGHIRLAGASGGRVSSHHEHATIRKIRETRPHHFPESSLYPIANHRRANRTADDKAYLRWATIWNREQVRTDGPPAGSPPVARHEPELLWPPNPRFLRQHDVSNRDSQARAGLTLPARSCGLAKRGPGDPRC
jgi:hypothetical protein